MNIESKFNIEGGVVASSSSHQVTDCITIKWLASLPSFHWSIRTISITLLDEKKIPPLLWISTVQPLSIFT
jgi:hypothetical protein